MKLNYIIVNKDDKRFKNVCNYIEKHIVKENLRENGGTLNFTNLTYNSDYLIICTKRFVPIGFNSIIQFDNNLYINQIGVKNKYKKQGIGTQMMQMVIDIATAADIAVSADVRDYNIASQKMFQSLGFEKIDEYSTEEGYYYELDIPSINEKKKRK